MLKFPHCVSYDIKKQVAPLPLLWQVHELATAVYQIRGHIKGKTLLPFPQGIADLDDEERRVRESDGKEVTSLYLLLIQCCPWPGGHTTQEQHRRHHFEVVLPSMLFL